MLYAHTHTLQSAETCIWLFKHIHVLSFTLYLSHTHTNTHNTFQHTVIWHHLLSSDRPVNLLCMYPQTQRLILLIITVFVVYPLKLLGYFSTAFNTGMEALRWIRIQTPRFSFGWLLVKLAIKLKIDVRWVCRKHSHLLHMCWIESSYRKLNIRSLSR